ncbi:alginate O-acetyltransferase AlgX-related protein [Spirochaeta dissipatitropha]
MSKNHRQTQNTTKQSSGRTQHPTDPGQKFIRGIFAVVMIFILLTGFAVSIPAVIAVMRTEQPIGSARQYREKLEAVLSGQVSADFQNQYDESLPLQEPSLWIWTAFRYAFFREGLQGVLVGRDGWLFSSEEFITPGSPEKEQQRIIEIVESIEQVSTQLQLHGAELLLIPIPAKARIYPQKLGRHVFPWAAKPRYEGFLQDLNTRGLYTVDLASLFQDLVDSSVQVFLRSDTHWTPDAAEAAAAATAAYLHDMSTSPQLENREYRVQRGELQDYAGDLLNFLPLGPFQDMLEHSRDSIPELHIEAGPAPILGLFDSASVPVVLIGTSYSAGEQWGFAAFLQEQLQAEVLNLAMEGRGPFQPMQEYLQSDTLLEAPPSLVIWEIPERYLVVDSSP